MVTTRESQVPPADHALPDAGHHLAAELGREMLHEVDVVADEVSGDVVAAWFVLVAVLATAAPLAGSLFLPLWALGAVTAVAGAVPFWRGRHRSVAAGGVAVAVVVPLLLGLVV